MGTALAGTGSYTFAPKKLDFDWKNKVTSLAKPSIEEPPMIEIMPLLSHLYYAFLGANNTLLVVIIADLLEWKVEALVSILQKLKRSIGWSIVYIIGILDTQNPT